MSEAPQPHASPYRVLADTAEDHIFVINHDDRIEYVNPAAARQLGTVSDRLVGRRRAELFPPDVAERQGRNLTRVISTGTPLYVEGRTMYGDREVWLSTWLTPVHSHAGDVTAVLGVSPATSPCESGWKTSCAPPISAGASSMQTCRSSSGRPIVAGR